ncbi:neutral zinc metallopeptidase [Actinokineospora fastidiosa]|uniref:neutral zinc metallopeptidase n=1 Tax=Actinokineospora fastidiosa TaxID=1816 RepID=UPI00167077DD|nr:neutral zinc metallopeptidase [Actinokineospora fastidiosa]
MRVNRVAVAAALAVAVIAGCGQAVPGQPRAAGAVDAGTAGGLPIDNSAPTGPREGVADAELAVENADSGEMDRLAVNVVADLYDYWNERMPADFDGQKFEPIARLASYDSAGKPVELCGTSTKGLVNAFYCGADDSIAWDRGKLLPMLDKQFGPMSVVAVLAHEMGHAVQFRLGEKSNINQATPTIVKEQQADCYAGGFFRYVAEGKAKHFTMNTGTGLNQALATMFFIRDPAGLSAKEQGAHGLAFDRVFAFQEGFTEGPKRCARMDVPEIEGRIAAQERSVSDQDVSGEADITDPDIFGLFEESLTSAFQGTEAELPSITKDGASCGGSAGTPPVSYCPDTNTVAADIPELVKIASPPKRGEEPGVDGNGIGDFAAFAEIVSRYALAVQKGVGAPLEGEKAGLRTACLVGAWAQLRVDKTPDEGDGGLHIAVGDLDEAVAELLQDNSLIAADVTGKQVPSGFARVEAFRIGYFEGDDGCARAFSA